MILFWLLLLAGSACLSVVLNPAAKALPSHLMSYGSYALLATLLGSGIIMALFTALASLTTMPIWPAYGLTIIPAVAAVIHCRHIQCMQRRARAGFEHLALWGLAAAATVAILTSIGIILAVIVESLNFFQLISWSEFLFGTTWSPQIAIREDQAGASGAFGILPLLAGTLLITIIAMTVATPTGLIIAIYLSEFALSKTRTRVKPILEMLAGIPTIVYGFFAVVVLSPFLRDLVTNLNLQIAGESALAAGLVLGMMLIPFIASLSEGALFAVPESLRQGALALGSTRYETSLQVMIPAAAPGVIAGILLATSRAVGETMIVVMAAGIAANMTINPLQAVTTVTVQIVTLLTGDQEFDDAKTLAAFALGLVLFCITLILNLLAFRVIRRYQRQYYD